MTAITSPRNNFVKCKWDGVFRHKTVPVIRRKAIAMSNEAMNASDVLAILKETMDSIQNKEHWTNQSSKLVTNKPDAIITAAAFIFYHGGVEIAADNAGKTWGISSKGYYHYCG